ncbi:MAG: TIR domain-containing protein [Lentisphaeria bacterium]|nr:TIR domain-containing protein [Lentisphaeria bacterium]
MSDQVLYEHIVCILADADDVLAESLINEFSSQSIETTLITPQILSTKTFQETCQIFQESICLILLLNSENLKNSLISYAIQHFEICKKDRNIIPIYTGNDFSDSKVSESPIIRKFGNQFIESVNFSPNELLNAIMFRVHGFANFLELAKQKVQNDPQTRSDNIFTIRNSSLRLINGNILDSKCDVIVSSDDNLLTHGGGVSLAIFNAGGNMIETDTKKHLPAPLGEVVVSTAGNLVQKMIFHAITIALVNYENRSDELLSKIEQIDIQEYIICNVVRRCFLLLSSLHLSSIAFPVIGSGTAKIPFEKAVSCMLKTFSREISRTAQAWKIELWVYQDNGIDLNSMAKEILVQENKTESLSLFTPPKVQMKHDVFISYSRKDSEKIQKILSFLKEKNISFWIDIDGAYSGKSYKSEIIQAIRQANILLFLSSENSNKSEHVIKEISCAVSYKKTIIPVKIDNARYSDDIEYDLINIDYIDMENDSDALKKLYCSIVSRQQ